MKSLKAPKRNYCIQTLTHDYPKAGDFLELVVKQFIKNTDTSSSTDVKLDWFIRVNGINKNLQLTLDSLLEKYSDIINWHIFIGDNIGVGAGINFLNQKCTAYEYFLFIEGDWIITDKVNKNWLHSSLQILEGNPEYEQVFLRRYYSDCEDRVNGMSEWVNSKSFTKKIEVAEIEFLCLKEGIYTNNPSIRRQKAFFHREFFPLNEYYDQEGKPTELKGNPDWGRAEEDARTSFSKTFYLWPGVFNHEGGSGFGFPKIPCNTCKYGFHYTSDWFCLSCSKNDTFLDLSKHTSMGINTVLEFIEQLNNHKHPYSEEFISTTTNFVKNTIENPTISPEKLTKYYYDKS